MQKYMKRKNIYGKGTWARADTTVKLQEFCSVYVYTVSRCVTTFVWVIETGELCCILHVITMELESIQLLMKEKNRM